MLTGWLYLYTTHPTNVTTQVVRGGGVPNNARKFVVTAQTLFGPTDLEKLSQNHTESRHLPELFAYVED